MTDGGHDDFWKDNTLVCPVCGGCKCHTCSCPGGPRGPELHPGINVGHTETTQTITETINSMDYSTGYQYSATGSGVTANGNLSPGTGSTNVTINGVTSQWTGATSKPQFTQTVPGKRFSSQKRTQVLVYKTTRLYKE